MGNKKEEYGRAKDVIIKNPALEAHYNLDTIKKELEKLEDRHKELQAKREQVKGALITYEKYLELFGSIGVKLHEKHDMVVLDQILRKFFSNFAIKQYGRGKQQRWDIEYKLKEPWSGFLSANDFDRGRG